MKGRLEHDLKTNQKSHEILKDLPKYVSDFYYSLQSSTEPSTRLDYVRKIKLFLEFANMPIGKVDSTVIGRFFEKIEHKFDNDGEMVKTSFSYRQAYWSVLKKFFDFLEEKELIKKNPVDKNSRPRGKDEVARPALGIEDMKAILNAVKTGVGSKQAREAQTPWRERDILILFLFMNTGMRKTALNEINVDDISFKDKKLTVIDKRNKTQIYDVDDEMEKIIRAWLSRRKEILGNCNCDALFISSNKERMCGKAISNLVKKYSEAALGYEISPHKLRSAFVTIAYEVFDYDIEATRKAVGHSDISTTSRYIVQKNNSRTEAQSFMSKNLKI